MLLFDWLLILEQSSNTVTIKPFIISNSWNVSEILNGRMLSKWMNEWCIYIALYCVAYCTLNISIKYGLQFLRLDQCFESRIPLKHKMQFEFCSDCTPHPWAICWELQPKPIITTMKTRKATTSSIKQDWIKWLIIYCCWNNEHEQGENGYTAIYVLVSASDSTPHIENHV